MVGSLVKTLGDMKHDLDVSASHSQHEDHQISQGAGGSWQGNIVDVDGFDWEGGGGKVVMVWFAPCWNRKPKRLNKV